MGNVAHWRPKDCFRKNLLGFQLFFWPLQRLHDNSRFHCADKHDYRPLSATMADGVASEAVLSLVSPRVSCHCLEQTRQFICLKKSKMQDELSQGK